MSTTRPRPRLDSAQRTLESSLVDDDGKRVGPSRTRRRDMGTDPRRLVALAAIGFSAVYLLSDLIEVAQGNFSTFRLSLTYVGEAAIPLFVIGLYAVQRPQIGRLGLLGATAYAYSYVFFTSTVVYALVSGTPNYQALVTVFGAWMTLHGAIMLLGGLAFGLAVIWARVFPRWTGACLMVGMVLVVAASGLPNFARAVAEAFPAAAFIGMGFALLGQRPSLPASSGDPAAPGHAEVAEVAKRPEPR
jgi:hypothetical protein